MILIILPVKGNNNQSIFRADLLNALTTWYIFFAFFFKKIVHDEENLVDLHYFQDESL